MKKKPFFKVFFISAGTYKFHALVCVSADIDMVAKRMNKHFGYPNKKGLILNRDDYQGYRGRYFPSAESRCPAIWLEYPPKEPYEYGILFHEILHMIFDITRWAGIRLCQESEEAYTYLSTHLTEQILTKLNA